nr:hypothetical protein [Corynebacterium sp. UBA5992]
MLDWLSNSPLIKLGIEQFTYVTGLGADMYWPTVGGVFVALSTAPFLSSLSSIY